MNNNNTNSVTPVSDYEEERIQSESVNVANNENIELEHEQQFQGKILDENTFDLSSFAVHSDSDTMAIIDRIGTALLKYHQGGNRLFTTESITNDADDSHQQFLDYVSGAMMNEYNHILRLQKRKNKGKNLDTFEFIDKYLRLKYFKDDNVCVDIQKCKCMEINTRDRLNSNTQTTNTNEDEHNSPLTYLDLLLSSMHCSLLHAFDTGYRMTRNEMRIIHDIEIQNDDDDNEEMENENENENENGSPSVDDDLMDPSGIAMRQILNQRRTRYTNMRRDLDSQPDDNDNNALKSKFVTQMEHEQAISTATATATATNIHTQHNSSSSSNRKKNKSKNKNKNKNNSDTDDSNNATPMNVERGEQSSPLSYDFGVKFYYWKRYKNADRMDVYNNGGNYTFSDWYISQLSQSLKEEMLQRRNISVKAWHNELDKIRVWLKTEFVMKHLIAVNHYGSCYDIVENSPINEAQLMGLFVYTNFTALCTLFSRAFRRIPAGTESDASLKSRNAEFREWAKHLIECVHVFGIWTTTHCTLGQLFYHGISVEMVFPSMYAVFYSPTSTTTSLGVALNFAKTGLVLELMTNRSIATLPSFDCFMSDFNNEQETLFISGGMNVANPFGFSLLTFVSIRSLEFNENYVKYVTAISLFETIIKGYHAMTNTLSSKSSNVKALSRLISNSIGNKRSTMDASSNHGMCYLQSMFDAYVQTVKQVSILIPIFNLKQRGAPYNNPLFRNYRRLFCELYSDEVLAANRTHWRIDPALYTHRFHGKNSRFVNPIKSLKLALLLDVCPNVGTLNILQLPVTHYLMKSILKAIQQSRQNRQNRSLKYNALERVFVGIYFDEPNRGRVRDTYPLSQSDFVSYAQCKSVYEQAFQAIQWRMAVENNKTLWGNCNVAGVAMQSMDSTLDDKRVWQSFCA